MMNPRKQTGKPFRYLDRSLSILVPDNMMPQNHPCACGADGAISIALVMNSLYNDKTYHFYEGISGILYSQEKLLCYQKSTYVSSVL